MKIFIEITPELDAFVRSQVLAGKFTGVNAVVIHALKQLQAEADGMSVHHGDTQFDGFDRPFGPHADDPHAEARVGQREAAANTVSGELGEDPSRARSSTVWR